MIKLSYTQQDLIADQLLKGTVQMMLMLWARHDWEFLTCTNEWVFPFELLKYVIHYDCFVKMPEAARNGEVYPWISWREVNLAQEGEQENIKILTRDERKPDNYTPPLLHEWHYYIPSDITTRKNVQVMLANWCEIITIQQYLSLLPQETPTWQTAL